MAAGPGMRLTDDCQKLHRPNVSFKMTTLTIDRERGRKRVGSSSEGQELI
jgi:hypothetical protein